MKAEQAKPERKDDLKSLPMADLLVKLASSAGGLTQVEARETADTVRPQ